MQNRNFIKRLHQKLSAFILLASVLSGALPAAAQTKPLANKSTQKTSAKLCPNCWSGVITYTKTLEDKFNSNEPIFGTLSPDKERITHNDTRKYQYDARVVIDGTSGQNKTYTRIKFSDNDYKKSVQTELTRCHAFDPDRIVTAETVLKKSYEGSSYEPAENFNIRADDGTYHFGLSFAEIVGTFEDHTHIAYQNMCPDGRVAPPDYDVTRNEKVAWGETVSIDGKLDPKNPDVIKGSKTWGGETDGGVATFKYTATWSLSRKPAPLMITDVKFYQPVYPSPNDWRYIDIADHAVDGNQVKVVASILNLSGTERTATVQVKETKENALLSDGTQIVNIKPHEEEEVELIWDTSGYAWKDSGGESQSETNRQIEVTIPDDSMTKDIQIVPKPIITVPGVWSKGDDFHKFRDFVKVISDKWKFYVAPVDTYKIAADNAAAIDKKVRETQTSENAWHVDLVGHSTGGLASRVYVNSLMPTLPDGRPAAIHLIMVGTPNKGTPCVRGLDGIIARVFNRNADALGELTGANMKRFNLMVSNNNGTKFAALAGVSYPKTCQMDVPGDALVPNGSALWTVKEKKVSTAAVNHMQLLGEVSHFQQIRKWLAVPPKGDHAPATAALNGNFSNETLADLTEQNFGQTRRYGAMSNALSAADAIEADEPGPNFSTGVKLTANQSTEIEIPVTGGAEISLIIYASSNVSAVLLDDKGEIVGKNLAGSPEAGEIFRTITVKKPFQNGKWKLKLESREQVESEIAVTAFIDYKPEMFAGN